MIPVQAFSDELVNSFIDNISTTIIPSYYCKHINAIIREEIVDHFKKTFMPNEHEENKKYRIITNGRFFKIQKKHAYKEYWVDLKTEEFAGCCVSKVKDLNGCITFNIEDAVKSALRWKIEEDKYQKDKDNWVELKF